MDSQDWGDTLPCGCRSHNNGHGEGSYCPKLIGSGRIVGSGEGKPLSADELAKDVSGSFKAGLMQEFAKKMTADDIGIMAREAVLSSQAPELSKVTMKPIRIDLGPLRKAMRDIGAAAGLAAQQLSSAVQQLDHQIQMDLMRATTRRIFLSRNKRKINKKLTRAQFRARGTVYYPTDWEVDNWKPSRRLQP